MEGSAVKGVAVLQMDNKGFGVSKRGPGVHPSGDTHTESGTRVRYGSHITTGICKIQYIYISLDKKALPFLYRSLQISQVELEFR